MPSQLFETLGLNDSLCNCLTKLGFTKPTAIQAEAIPLVLRGQDIIACAQTGSGKTASFLLPLLQILSESSTKARMARAIIMEPTRELALQVYDQFVRFAGDSPLKAVLLVGGESMQQQERILQSSPDVLIVTPGRLLDLCERQKIMLFGIRYVVIDEADRMLDMGFLPDVTRIMEKIPVSRQTMLFSATFDDAIQKLTSTFMLAPKILTISKQGSTVDTISQYCIKAADAQKKNATIHLLEKHGVQNDVKIPSIIFCNRKVNVTTLVSFLKKQGYAADSLHGDLQQSTRNQTVENFKTGTIHVLVASDIAARGLDVEDLGLVINYDVPLNAEDYVHRIGRTGRAGKSGFAYTLVEERDSKKWSAIETLTDLKISVYEMSTVDAAPKAEANKKRKDKSTPKASAPNEDLKTEILVSVPEDRKITSFGPIHGFGDEIPPFFHQVSYRSFLPVEDLSFSQDNDMPIEIWSESKPLAHQKKRFHKPTEEEGGL